MDGAVTFAGEVRQEPGDGEGAELMSCIKTLGVGGWR